MKLTVEHIYTDILIAGGGTAGCYAACKLAVSGKAITIIEKADIKRSGCLAAGVNALNAYITKGHTPDFYVDYAERDAHGIARGDLLLTMAERLNACARALENMGLVILRDEQGNYVERGPRNIKINGENIKPLLAKAAVSFDNVTVYNHVNIIDFIVRENEIIGAAALSVRQPVLYIIHAAAVLCATGGAAGLYRPNQPGFSRHKLWYPPFNAGAGLAAGMRHGAEMTTLEMRFIALRCKDTIAPTGTIAQGAGAVQINSQGSAYGQAYGCTTSERLYGLVNEKRAGRGPSYLQTKGIDVEQELALEKAYLNMAPSQTLKWLEQEGPAAADVEIEGSEPYVVGDHTAAGFWVSTTRETTIKGLFAAGDVASGCPQKYVTGAMAEGDIAAEAIRAHLAAAMATAVIDEDTVAFYVRQEEDYLCAAPQLFSLDDIEEGMQAVMDEYAGGIATDYRYNAAGLAIADEKIRQLIVMTKQLSVRDMRELLSLHELLDRLLICRFLIAHLLHRRETRWHCFAENMDYPDVDRGLTKYLNSYMEDGNIHVKFRPIVTRRQRYEHTY